MQVKVVSDSRLENLRQSNEPKPTVLLSVRLGSSIEAICDLIKSFYDRDDVLCDDFLTDTVIIKSEAQSKSDILWTGLRRSTSSGEWAPEHAIQIEVDRQERLPEGPYFLTSDNRLTQAWQLFPDTQDAFAVTFVPALGKPYGLVRHLVL